MDLELLEVYQRAERAADAFASKLSPFEQDLFRHSHRIAFIAGFISAVMQTRFPKKDGK